jgi:hypothetical protein
MLLRLHSKLAPRSGVIHKLTLAHLMKKLPTLITFNGHPPLFISVFTTSHHWTLSSQMHTVIPDFVKFEINIVRPSLQQR